MRRVAYLVAVAALLALAPAAFAGSADTKHLEERITKIEQSLADLKSAWLQQGAEIANKMAMVEQVLQDQNSFRGSVDAISQQQQLLFDQFKKYIDEFESRLQTMEQKMALGAVDENPDAEASAVLPVGGKTGLYQEALNTVRDRRYTEAVGLFRNFVMTAPQHALADRAQFWVGECYYAMGEYQSAIDAYNMLLTKFPESTKTAVALFRKANAYAELGKMHEAQQTFRDLIAKAPNSKEAQHAGAQLQAIVNATAERVAP